MKRLGEGDGPGRQAEGWAARHAQGLLTFLPFRARRKVPDGKKILPLNDIGCVSYLTVGWITATVWKAFRVGLDPTDMFKITGPDDAALNAERFERIWLEERRQAGEARRQASLVRAAWRFGRTRFVISLVLVVLAMFFQFAGPCLVLKYLLDYIRDPLAPVETGVMLLVCLFLTQLFRNITFNMQQSIGIHTAIRLLSAVEFCGYSKLLRLTAPNEAALGQLITFTTADHERIQDSCVNGCLFIGTPFMFLMSIVYSIYLVGPSAIVGSVVILLFYPIMGVIASLTATLRLRVVTITDKRVTMMGEIINSMRLIKMYAWEIPFMKRVEVLRKAEIKELRKSALLGAVTSTISPSITIVAAFATFLTMTLAGIELTTTEAFTILSIFNAMQFSVGTLPWSLKLITEAMVGFRRLQHLLELKDFIHPSNMGKCDPSNTIEVANATLAWEVDEEQVGKKKKTKSVKDKKSNEKGNEVEKPVTSEGSFIDCLFNLNISVQRGELVGVAGAVGSGKTSFISAVMGEMKLQRGDVRIGGSLALVSQQAWIFNATLRENILMGSAMTEAWYHQVIEACALTSDIKLLSHGDMTEIGERGVTLSGGQKQRINLARALYADMDIYLLDDPLSAVDAKVGQHIFKKYIKEMLRGKTVLLVSHGLQFLKQCDRVVFFRNGEIAEQGTHEELMDQKDSLYFNMAMYDAKRNSTDEKKTRRNRQESSSVSELLGEEETVLQKEVETESSGNGEGWGALFKFLRHCASYPVQLFLFGSIVLFVVLRLATSIWLQVWIDDGDGLEELRRDNASWTAATHSEEEFTGFINYNPRLGYYQLVYGLIIVGMITFGFFKGAGLLITLTRGSLRVHGIMLKSIMNSPMAFFDKTPSGRIINRFSKDMDELDTRIPFLLEAVSQYSLMNLTQIILVCVIYPYFLVGFVIIGFFFVLLDFTMNAGILETKKLDNIMKSPVIHHITSSMAGVTIIRGFGKEAEFKARFNQFLNQSMSADCLFRLAQRWFMWRMDALGLFTITLTGVVVVATKGTVSPAIAGLALATVFQVSTFIPFVMKLKSMFRASVNSLERINEYISLPQEAPHLLPDRAPLDSWPHEGRIRMAAVNFRYRPDLPLVLRDITVDIGGGMKVGIVGRTGAGKSSLISTLLRLVELDSGSIVVDEVDISDIGLANLRSAVAVIPQDPVLFQGTVRYNIDPFDKHSDEEVWRALERANLKKKVSADKAQLWMAVEAEGENFSVGEKQLICLARALLRRNKILLLDEATASVDVETDHAIQCTIQEAFSGCTVLTIAHRLNTVMGYDLVMVLDQGKLVETGSPQQLLKSGGIFESMAKAAGLKI